MKFVFITLLIVCSQLLTAQGLLDLQHPKLNPQADMPKVNTVSNGEKKSPALAILLSGLLPGMGELYAGTFSTSGKYFTICEGAFITTYIGISSYASWQKANFKSYAVKNGEVNGQNFSDDFYATISNYSNIKQYNDEKALYGQYSQLYDSQTAHWDWKTETNRKEYRTMWVATQHANNNLRFVVGAMLLNRLFSIIDAVRSVTAHNKSIDAASAATVNEPNFLLSAYPAEFNSVVLNCRYNF